MTGPVIPASSPLNSDWLLATAGSRQASLVTPMARSHICR